MAGTITTYAMEPDMILERVQEHRRLSSHSLFDYNCRILWTYMLHISIRIIIDIVLALSRFILYMSNQ